MSIAEADWAVATEILRSASEVVLVAHVGPDGDALGSALGLGLALRDLGVRVCVSYGDDPFDVPSRLMFLPGLDLLVPPSAVPDDPGVVVTFDTGSVDRLGALAASAKAAGVLLVVDHHTTNTFYGTHHLVDATAPATASIVLELVDRLGVSVSTDIATAIYTGLVTDTGSFKFAATTPAVHETAARLLRAGVDHERVAREVFDTRTVGYLHLLGLALESAVFEPEALDGLGIIWTVVPARLRAEYAVPLDEVEAVIGTLRLAAEAEVSVVLKGLDGTAVGPSGRPSGGGYAVSTRSKGAVDVATACLSLGGGGHRYAAGYTSGLSAEETMRALRDALAAARS